MGFAQSGGAAKKNKKKPAKRSPAPAKKAKTTKTPKVTSVVRTEKFDDGHTRNVCKLEGKGNTLYTQYDGKWVSVTKLKAKLAKETKAKSKEKKTGKAVKAKAAPKAKAKPPPSLPAYASRTVYSGLYQPAPQPYQQPSPYYQQQQPSPYYQQQQQQQQPYQQRPPSTKYRSLQY